MSDNPYKAPQTRSQAPTRALREKDYLPALILFLLSALSLAIAPMFKSHLLLAGGLGLAVASIVSIFVGRR